MYTVKQLQDLGALPKKLEVVDVNSSELATKADYEKLMELGEADERVVVVNNPQWVVKTQDGTYYAMREDGKISRSKKGQKDWRLDALNSRNRLSTVEIDDLRKTSSDYEESKKAYETFKAGGGLQKNKTTKEKKEVKNMSGVDFNFEAVQNKLAEQAGDLAPTSTAKLDIESGITSEATKHIQTMESDMVNRPGHLIEVADFNRNNGGRLVCLVTDKDAKLNLTAKKPAEKKKGAGADFNSQGTGTASNTENMDNSRTLAFSQSTPGKVLGGVVKLPQGGVYTIEQLESGMVNGQPLSVDYNAKDMKTMLLDAEALKAYIGYGFDGIIPEDPQTYGSAAGNTRVEIASRTRLNKSTNQREEFSEIVLKSDRGGKLLSPSAYFPIKTYLTKELNDKKLTQDDIDTMNFSMLYTLYNATASNLPAVKKLKATDAGLISREEKDGKVTYSSKFIALNGGDVEIKVRPWYGAKEDLLSNIEVPIKELKINAEKGTKSAKFVVINAIKDMGAPLYNDVSSLNSGRFENVIEASDGELNLKNLTATFGKSGKSKKALEKLATGAANYAEFSKLINVKKSGIDSTLRKYR